MKISVIILSWNGREMTAKCLDSLRKQTWRDYETIVVDNGSKDGSVEMLERDYTDYPNLTVLSQARNMGFDEGCNIGIRAAKGEFIAVLNNDAAPEPDWLERLAAVMVDNPKVAVCQPKVLQIPKTTDGYLIDTTGDFYHIWGMPHPRGRDEVDRGQYDKPEEIFAANAAAALFRKAVFDKIGWFDKEFFAYYEDVDISFRARLAGFIVWYEPKAVVYHLVGGSSGGKVSNPFTRYLMPKNLWYLYLRNMPGWLFWKYLGRFVFLQALSWANAFRIGGWKLGWAHTRSILRGIVMTPVMVMRRWRIQSRRVISAEEVDALLLRSVPSGVGPAFRKYLGWLIRDEKS